MSSDLRTRNIFFLNRIFGFVSVFLCVAGGKQTLLFGPLHSRVVGAIVPPLVNTQHTHSPVEPCFLRLEFGPHMLRCVVDRFKLKPVTARVMVRTEVGMGVIPGKALG